MENDRISRHHLPWFLEHPSRPRRSVPTRLARTWRTSWWTGLFSLLGDWGFYIRNLEKTHEYPIWSETTRNSLMKFWKEKHAMNKLSASCQLHRNVFFRHPLLFICWGVRMLDFSIDPFWASQYNSTKTINHHFWIISLGNLNPQISMGSGWAPSFQAPKHWSRSSRSRRTATLVSARTPLPSLPK